MRFLRALHLLRYTLLLWKTLLSLFHNDRLPIYIIVLCFTSKKLNIFSFHHSLQSPYNICIYLYVHLFWENYIIKQKAKISLIYSCCGHTPSRNCKLWIDWKKWKNYIRFRMNFFFINYLASVYKSSKECYQ